MFMIQIKHMKLVSVIKMLLILNPVKWDIQEHSPVLMGKCFLLERLVECRLLEWA